MLASVPAGYTPQFVHTPTAKAGSVLVYNGQCWHSGGSHPGEPGIGERHSLFAHYRKSCKRSTSLCLLPGSLKESCCADCVFQCDPHDGFPEEWWPGLSERQKQLFRMIHPPGAPHSADHHFGAVQPPSLCCSGCSCAG